MALDQTTEQLLSLADAVKVVPAIDGRRPHISTIWRWCRRGLRGVRLEYVRLGHRVCTSREAIYRFAQRLAEADSQQVTDKFGTAARVQTRPGQNRDIEAADRELKRAGI